MSSEPPNSSSSLQAMIAQGFRKRLNSQGFPFQNAIFKLIEETESSAGWTPWLPEFPVVVQGQSTRIDLILANGRGTLLLVCECKRANPSLANWCFARASFQPHSSLSSRSYFERLHWDGKQILSDAVEIVISQRLYEIAEPIKLKTEGESEDTGKGRGEIEDAATQVCRGLNGLIDFYYKRGMLGEGQRPVGFIPVIITTANLWVSPAEVGSASLKTGELQNAKFTVQPINWLWYRYHQSPGLKHSAPHASKSRDLREILFYEFVRPIAIVNPAGIPEFLQANVWELS